jgi:carboxypeptidase Taq
MIHELGHGLYEQRNDTKFHYTNLHYGASTWMHESQSRTLENMIGKSRGMSIYLDKLSRQFWRQYSANEQDRYAVCTNVHPSYIRIEADEISYGLHVLLRYELEKQLIEWTLAVHDLPAARNEKMHKYLGITPPTDTVWCLQDVHRSCGLFGYFPTYLLGNLYAGQLRQVFSTQHRTWETEVAQGNFSSYFNRYKENVRTHGRSLSPQELLKKITGKPLDASYFLEYLNHKFS